MDSFIQITRGGEQNGKSVSLDDPFQGMNNNGNINIVRDPPSQRPSSQSSQNYFQKNGFFKSSQPSSQKIDLGFDLLSNPKKKLPTGPSQQKSSDGFDIQSDIDLENELRSELGLDNSDNISLSDGGSALSGNNSGLGSNTGYNNNNTFNNFNSGGYEASESSYSASDDGSDAALSQLSGMSEGEIYQRKKDCLYELEKMRRKGIKLEKEYTMATPLKEMMKDLEILKRDRQTELSVKFQRKMLLAFVSGAELLTNKFNHPLGVDLDGWSESVMENVNDYDEIFEELYEKYKTKANMPPEMKLLLTLGGSAFMFHLTKSLTKSPMISGFANMMGGVPMSNMAPPPQQQPQFGFMGGMNFPSSQNMNNLREMNRQFESRPPPMEKEVHINTQRKMQPPRGVDDILQEMNRNQPSRKKDLDNISVDDIDEVLSVNDRLDQMSNADIDDIPAQVKPKKKNIKKKSNEGISIAL